MNPRKHLLNAKRTALLAIAVLFFSAFAAVKDDLFLISKNLDIFAAVYRQISLNYVDDTDPNALIKTAVDAMLDELDPYTEYVQEADIEDYKLRYVNPQYGGIGASIFGRDGNVFIAEPYAGYAADEAGIQAGDQLLHIDGKPVEHLTPAEASHLLRGAEHSQVVLEIQKPRQPSPLSLTLTRKVVRQPNVSHTALLAGGIGYIRLDKFLERSSNEVAEALAGLEKKAGHLSGLVLDLRNNGGGILQEAVKIVNLFVQQGELVVSQKGKNASKAHSYRTMAGPVMPEIPLTVLINGRSASAAEIVAGALQDLDRAVVIGERSFGKGLVQQTFNIPYNNLVKVTVAKYYTPSGRCIQAREFIHRDSKGEYARVSDSLIRAFNTKSGRVVYDGSGVYPDVRISEETLSPLAQALSDRYVIFDYATTFREKHARIADADKFEVSENLYADFIQFLEDQDHAHATETQALRQDLLLHRDEIKRILGSEIVSRYYYKSGRTLFSYRYDTALQRAQALLSAGKAEYHSILAGEGSHKTIGGPETLLASAETSD